MGAARIHSKTGGMIADGGKTIRSENHITKNETCST
jgi:hypothetical protein